MRDARTTSLFHREKFVGLPAMCTHFSLNMTYAFCDCFIYILSFHLLDFRYVVIYEYRRHRQKYPSEKRKIRLCKANHTRIFVTHAGDTPMN